MTWNMNVSFLASMCRLAAMVLLPCKLHVSRSAAGVSLKTQELYLLVFSTRFLGFFVHSRHFVYHGMTVASSIIPAALTVGMLKYRPCLKASYDASLDRFRLWMHGIVPSFVLAVIVYSWQGLLQYFIGIYHPSAVQFAWIFSEVLEPLAVVPQLLVSRGSADAGRLVWAYVILMGVYRLLYLLDWMYRAHYDHIIKLSPLVAASVFMQTGMYIVFVGNRRVRVSSHLPPHETGDGDIMELTPSARGQLLPDKESDTDSRRNRKRGLDGEVHGESSRETA